MTNFWTGAVCEAVEQVSATRGAITERRENLTNKTVWCARFTHPDGDVSPGRVLWLDGPAEDGAWFGAEDAKWFAMAISLKRNVSVKFDTLEGACKFMSLLKSARVS